MQFQRKYKEINIPRMFSILNPSKLAQNDYLFEELHFQG